MASSKQFIEKRNNIASIVSFVRSRVEATRLEIASALSLSWACVSDLVSLLIEQNILFEFKRTAQQGESVGRTPTYLSLNPEKYFLGVDINDSGFSVAVGLPSISSDWYGASITNHALFSRSMVVTSAVPVFPATV